MPVERRSTPRFVIAALAVPVIAAVYVAVFSRRIASVGRSLVIAVLGATVIGSVYAEAAARGAVVPARRAPLPLTLAAVLAVTLVGSGLPVAPVRAHNAHAEAVVDAAMAKVGSPYVWGTEGPDTFDCSGLVYWAFKRAGALELIGGSRTTAARYYKYFATRGMTSKSDGRRGDLVIYGGGTHIGIYLGEGKVVGALNPREGVLVHGLHALRTDFTTFLNVDWGSETAEPEDAPAETVNTTAYVSPIPQANDDDDDSDSTDGDGAADDDESTEDDATDDDDRAGDDDSAAEDAVAVGHAFGSLNLRVEANPDATIIGWVSRGTTFAILGSGRSPSGALWYEVRKPSGKEGWIWSRWVRVVDGSVE